jgi:hypothetical protein
MKKIMVMVALAAGMASCNKENNVETTAKGGKKENTVPVEYVSIGEVHNTGLAFMYDKFRELSDANGGIPKEKVLQFAEDYSRQYMQSLGDGDGFSDGIIDIVNEVYGLNNYLSSKEGEYANYLDYCIHNGLLNLNDVEASYMNKIVGALDKAGSASEVGKSLMEIEKDIQSAGLESKSVELLLASSVVCRYSAEYWENNLSDWALLGSSEKELPKWAKDIIKSDLAGGAVGGVVGAIAGGTVSLGTLTIPGWVSGAASGALTASGRTGIRKLLDYLWN